MELKSLTKKYIPLLKKYKYAVLVLAIGFVLIAMPTKQKNTNSMQTESETETNEEVSMEQQLSAVLSQIDGAGAVQVLLTVSKGEEIVYQENTDHSNAENSSSINTDTVTVSKSDKSQTGLIRQINPPEYLGAIIVCQGADDPNIRLAIVDAVSKITGLGANRISVLKMK